MITLQEYVNHQANGSVDVLYQYGVDRETIQWRATDTSVILGRLLDEDSVQVLVVHDWGHPRQWRVCIAHKLLHGIHPKLNTALRNRAREIEEQWSGLVECNIPPLGP